MFVINALKPCCRSPCIQRLLWVLPMQEAVGIDTLLFCFITRYPVYSPEWQLSLIFEDCGHPELSKSKFCQSQAFSRKSKSKSFSPVEPTWISRSQSFCCLSKFWNCGRCQHAWRLRNFHLIYCSKLCILDFDSGSCEGSSHAHMDWGFRFWLSAKQDCSMWLYGCESLHTLTSRALAARTAMSSGMNAALYSPPICTVTEYRGNVKRLRLKRKKVFMSMMICIRNNFSEDTWQLFWGHQTQRKM